MPTLPKSKKKPWVIQRETKSKGSRRFQQNNSELDVYQTKQWKGTRSHHIRMNPICKQCKEEDGRVVPGEVVDHIIPVRQGGKPFDFDNLQTLCHDHHNIKSRMEKDSITYTRDTMYG
tara:strand:+ start:2740 stop:3093 length:354 start_codon:yes stop_codon:yes gene_type:complete